MKKIIKFLFVLAIFLPFSVPVSASFIFSNQRDITKTPGFVILPNSDITPINKKCKFIERNVNTNPYYKSWVQQMKKDPFAFLTKQEQKGIIYVYNQHYIPERLMECSK